MIRTIPYQIPYNQPRQQPLLPTNGCLGMRCNANVHKGCGFIATKNSQLRTSARNLSCYCWKTIWTFKVVLKKRKENQQQQRMIGTQRYPFHALMRWSTSNKMRVKAQIGDHILMALIDNGSTHNFMSTKVAKKLQLSAIPTTTFLVHIDDGNQLQYTR